MFNKKLIILTTLSITSCYNSAMAGKYYGLVEGGVSAPKKFSAIDYYSKKPSKAALFKIGFGYQFNDKFRSDLTLEFRNSYNFKTQASALNATNQQVPVSIQQKISSKAIRLNGYYDICHYNGFTPYITAGIGVARNKVGSYKYDLSETQFDVWEIWSGKTNNKLTWGIGLGSKIDLSSNFKIDLAYRYTDLGKSTTTNIVNQSIIAQNAYLQHLADSNLGNISSIANHKKLHLAAHELTIGLSYNF